jgi:hypothetical protein
MRLFTFYVIAAVLTTVAHAGEPGIAIKTGFLTGNSYRALAPESRRAYAIGLLDGMFLSPFFDANKQKLEWLERCATGMGDKQVAAIFDKYLRDNPGRWHETMHVLGWTAMKDACGS